jgi:hemerythrin
MAIEWTDAYSTGIPRLDEQHKAMFALLNDLERLLAGGEPVPPEAEAIVDRFVRQSEGHFSYEERCMLRHKCPYARTNELAHAAFLRSLEEVRESIRREGPSGPLLRRLHAMAQAWLVIHICHTDAHLRACVRKRGGGSRSSESPGACPM